MTLKGKKEIKNYLVFIIIFCFVWMTLKRFNRAKWLRFKKFLERNNNETRDGGKWKKESEAVIFFKQALALRGYSAEGVLVNHRPDFLRNPHTGCNLELDAFDPISKNAIEYNGVQHYEYPNVFHKCKKDFELQVSRDRFKTERCAQENINLITIPYTEKNIFTFILARIK